MKQQTKEFLDFTLRKIYGIDPNGEIEMHDYPKEEATLKANRQKWVQWGISSHFFQIYANSFKNSKNGGNPRDGSGNSPNDGIESYLNHAMVDMLIELKRPNEELDKTRKFLLNSIHWYHNKDFLVVDNSSDQRS